MTVCYEKLMSNLLLLPLQFLTFSLQYNIEKKIDSDDEDDDEDDDDAFSKKKNVPDDPMARKFFFSCPQLLCSLLQFQTCSKFEKAVIKRCI